MRPPDLPGGNHKDAPLRRVPRALASMRPPDLPGGNLPAVPGPSSNRCFNEAAGFTRRKPPPTGNRSTATSPRFNEAAGFTRRKHAATHYAAPLTTHASMRPPDLPGGNN